MRPLVLVCVLAFVLAVPAAAATPIRAKLTTATTQPVADTPWRYTITVKDGKGRPLAAKARLQILLGTTVVGCWKGTAMVPCQGPTSGTWIPFRGRRTGTLTWPAQAVGVTLTFRATVLAGGRVLRLRTAVRVQPAS
jgi:hypothetical protein